MTFGDRQQTRIRHKLLLRVRHDVQAHLSQSLHHQVLTALSNEPNPLGVGRPGDIQVKLSGSPTTQLDPSTSPFNLFDQTGGVWVVLGNIGSGKTTTLLELADEAIARAQTYNHQPIPLLFDLSQWYKYTLSAWLIEQSFLNYELPRKVAKKWLFQGQILVILDNLDTLSFDRQNQTLQAIKELRANTQQSLHLILGSRIDSYKRCPTRLKLQGAVWLKPLNPTQIKDYLFQARSRELWHSLHEYKGLMSLATTPLFLNLMTLADEEILIHAWARISDSEQQYRYLFNAYLRRLLAQDLPSDERQWYRSEQRPKPEETKHWLIALAKWMQKENRTNFASVDVNAGYFQAPEQNRHYHIGVGIATALLFGAICGVIIAALVEGLGLGLMISLILGTVLAGLGILISLSSLRKFMLRYQLYREDLMPWDNQRFLNYASSKGLIQKIGDRYQFPHQLIQEHFAQIEEFKL
ncbi:MAG: NACHT domain-containing protein [Roseofilum sp. SBFL]|uniref:NACHT domain-containing protein n=1 Tax=unclassified Roseofilum TaxID=2620099 RepID=UPI001B04A8B0|nr:MULTISPECIES: NACHT domain-containing protein [unclassified Roseofilum]MBP0015134.1 NACHT domain-containing protein [Roseofilum sp. SID3]MBP0023330.1 NACHT domain-containing protein [Roseofilum sp. SID2]MBP0036377.1 NACHT domain-containing protein [Roseofilum sp. SID1]MBP0042624.1 NACHT domain-containing protein [Roseofilum sp. SBFL]